MAGQQGILREIKINMVELDLDPVTYSFSFILVWTSGDSYSRKLPLNTTKTRQIFTVSLKNLKKKFIDLLASKFDIFLRYLPGNKEYSQFFVLFCFVLFSFLSWQMKSQLILLTMFERFFFCFFVFSFDIHQGHMGEGEVTLLFLTFECISCIWRGPKFAQFLTLIGKRGGGVKYSCDRYILSVLQLTSQTF